MTDPGSAKFDVPDTKHHGAPKTDAQLKTQSTYSAPIFGDGDGGLDWKFGGGDDNPWKILEGSSLPFLYWQQE